MTTEQLNGLYAAARRVDSLDALGYFVACMVTMEHDPESLVHAVSACAVAGAAAAESLTAPLSPVQVAKVQWEFLRGWGKTPQGPRPDPLFSDEDQLADFVLYRRLNGLGFNWANGQDLLESVIEWRKLTKEEETSHDGDQCLQCGLACRACCCKLNEVDRAYNT